MPGSLVHFNRPWLVGREMEFVEDAVRSLHTSGNGKYTRLCEDALGEELGGASVLLTTSCTDALEMTALLLGIEPLDEVIVPSFTFVSTANAYALRGARPVFSDVRPDTLNLDETRLEALITPRTKAIVVVHYAGVACEMDTINGIAERHGVAVVEDNAHGLFGRYRGRPLGTLSPLATQSFHETKNISCGEGGALVLNDERYVQRAEILREKGTDRARFFRGEVDKYTWNDVGSSFLPSDLLAAYLYGQLVERERIQASRSATWATYARELSGWADSNGVTLPTVPDGCEHPSHLFYALLPSAAERTRFIAHMRARDVHAVFHYVPLHSSPKGLELGGEVADCPVTTDVSARLVRLPLFGGMTDGQVAQVVEAALAFESA